MAEFLSHSHTAVTQKPFTYQAHRMFHIRAFCFRSLVTLGVRFLFVQLLQFFSVCVMLCFGMYVVSHQAFVWLLLQFAMRSGVLNLSARAHG